MRECEVVEDGVKCQNKVYVKKLELCQKHYIRFHRYGNPLKIKSRPQNISNKEIVEYWLQKALVDPVSECWTIPGIATSAGYPRVQSENGKNRRLSHLIVETRDGVELGMETKIFALHLCDSPPCVNPSHLEAGTQKENMRQMCERNRGNPSKGEKNNRATITDEQAREIKILLRDTKLKHREIADMFSISTGVVGLISAGRNWKHIIISERSD